ncbi:MAG: Anaerobic ribonucleoside-triphosphate reductase [Parcubacteria group bacterium ADurb.Bin216]|nr:MAG: Anaerobic ribonucleoside-triphosphate reductase [Parcubacteria group bacterium ADurb.Bin216]
MKVIKRNKTIEDFDIEKIARAINKAGMGIEDARMVAKNVSDLFIEDTNVAVDDIHDAVEAELVAMNQTDVVKQYIIYRAKHKKIRKIVDETNNKLIQTYLDSSNWDVKDNANSTYSLAGLHNYVTTETSRRYWFNKIYSKTAAKAHESGDLYISDLGMLSNYCCGWDLADLLAVGFRGSPGKNNSKPAKHFSTALNQMVNFIFAMSGEAAGAQAFSNVDTMLAPYIYYDNLSYDMVKQLMQELIFSLNVATRSNAQCPFSNFTLDLTCPNHMKELAVMVGGEMKDKSYGEFQDQMDMFNRAFCEVMSEGDADGRVLTFPIPTYNITSEFDFDDPRFEPLWAMTAKYGIPYFANMVSGDIKPEDIRSLCCRYRAVLDKLAYKGGGLFGAGSLTGSVGVITINLPRLGYLSKDKKDFYKRLDKLLEIAYDTLEKKREFIEEQTERGLYPYTKYYLRNIKARTGKYWINHFSTIGIIGANECCLNMFGEDITAPASREFILEVMDYLRDKLITFQERSGSNWNLEATPAESVTSRLARIDSTTFKDCHYQGTSENPYYTNSTALPVNFTEDLFEYLDHQDEFQTKYTGGTVAHLFLGEQIPPAAAKELVRKVCYNYKLPYISLTPTFSVCPEHGYIAGEHAECPTCNAKTEVYSRIVGYLRPINNWNASKEQEFRDRKTFNIKGE